MRMDLNCDLGEGFGPYGMGQDELIMPHITSANLACGFHAGDPQVMDRALGLAQRHGVAVGAHPGYLDLRGFGRRALECSGEELRTDLLYQLGALAALAQARGQALQHVKPHGALYNRAVQDPQVAQALCQALAQFDPGLILVCLAGPGGQVLRQEAARAGLRRLALEAFADRAYTPRGTLAPRGQPGALICDQRQVVERCLRLASQGVVEALDGSLVELEAHTICLHGDTPQALELAQGIRRGLEGAGVRLVPLSRIIP